MTLSTRGLALAAALALASTAEAQLTTYTQDFEGVDAMSSTAISADGWNVYGYVVDNGVFAYGYGPFPAPNPGAGFSAIGSGSGGASQGAQYLDIYSDYANGDHNNLGVTIDAAVYKEDTITTADVGETFTFSFDHLKNPTPINGDGAAVTQAFIKVFMSSDGSFSPLAIINLDTTNSSTTTWSTDILQVTIDPSWVGEIIQFGFSSIAGNNDDTSRFYDNISWSSPNSNPPGLSPFAQDFEALDAMNAAALSDDRWLVYANVFDTLGGYLYGYGAVAPNGGNGFSVIETGSQGPGQGQQYVNVFNDYNNQDHANGFRIDALVYQEQEIGQGDVGKTYKMNFDFLKNPTVTNGDGATTTSAFIKILQQSNLSFATLAIDAFDTTGASTTVWGSNSVEVTIDPSWVGEIIQFGFESNATNFDDSGRFYDNVVFAEAQPIGANYCSAPANSSGAEASMSASGSDVASDNNLTLKASSMPNNQFGIFVVSAVQGFTPGLGGTSNGNLCLGGVIGRYRQAGQILPTGTTGSFDLQINLTTIPQGNGTVSVAAGQRWNFQAWFRDGVGLGSNLTDGYTILFQ